MSLAEHYLDSDDIDPIDIVERLAEVHEWQFDRLAHDQIAMAVEAQWRTYSLTLACSPRDDTLRLICTFELKPPEDRLAALYEMLNAANDTCWSGAFTFWPEAGMMAYRYGLLLAEEQPATPAQIDGMITTAVAACERFYPAFQLVCWGDRTPADALQIAIAQAYGRA